jgi:hypothetical protein
MIARFQYLNYDNCHDTAETIYRMLITRIRLKLRFGSKIPPALG